MRMLLSIVIFCTWPSVNAAMQDKNLPTAFDNKKYCFGFDVPKNFSVKPDSWSGSGAVVTSKEKCSSNLKICPEILTYAEYATLERDHNYLKDAIRTLELQGWTVSGSTVIERDGVSWTNIMLTNSSLKRIQDLRYAHSKKGEVKINYWIIAGEAENNKTKLVKQTNLIQDSWKMQDPCEPRLAQ